MPTKLVLKMDYARGAQGGRRLFVVSMGAMYEGKFARHTVYADCQPICLVILVCQVTVLSSN